MKGRWIVYILAAAAGIALALPFDRLQPAPRAGDAAGTKGVRPLSYHSMPVGESPPPGSAVPKVYANQGLELEPLRADDLFVGYLVVRSHDPRLSVGDVITAVAGQHVEEGAAGSELLIAALRNPDAEITLQQRTDWPLDF